MDDRIISLRGSSVPHNLPHHFTEGKFGPTQLTVSFHWGEVRPHTTGLITPLFCWNACTKPVEWADMYMQIWYQKKDKSFFFSTISNV
jgi:hypothetical protein